MNRKENNRQVVIKSKDKTDVWEKNRPGGITTKEGHTTHHKSGNVTSHYGKIIGNDKKKKW